MLIFSKKTTFLTIFKNSFVIELSKRKLLVEKHIVTLRVKA